MVLNRAPAVSASGKNEEVPQDGPRKGSLCTVCEACEQSQLLLTLRGGVCTHRYGLRYRHR